MLRSYQFDYRSMTTAPKFRVSRLFWVGFILFLLGSGPLLAIIFMASMGLTRDPNPNPVGFGILAGLTFWPSLILIIVGFVKSWRRYQRLQEKSQAD
jgi:hypothetical protein